MNRKPFKKDLSVIGTEAAHGGSGSRQLILSDKDAVSSNLSAMTKGFLEPGGVFDWHLHEGIDEFFLSVQGKGQILFRDGSKMDYGPNQLVYIPSSTEHRIENTDTITNEFYFIRIKK